MIDPRAWGAAVAGLALRATRDPSARVPLAGALVGWPALGALVGAGQAVDRLVGDVDDPPAPLFVVGHPRSGTSFLHRLLACSPQLRAPLARELVLPSRTLQRTLARSWSGPIAPAAALAGRHDLRWDGPEEDDWLLLHGAASPTLEFLTGDPGSVRRWWFGDRLPPRDRDRALAWYRRCLRHLPRPAGTRPLSKNPHFAGWLRTLATEFPDARFVLIARDPAEAIASRLALVELAWRSRSRLPPPRDPRYAALFETSCALYREAEEGFAALPAGRGSRVGYAALVADPERVMARVGDEQGLRFHGLAELAASARTRVPGPRPSLRVFGIAPRRVRDRLGDLDPLWSSVASSA